MNRTLLTWNLLLPFEQDAYLKAGFDPHRPDSDDQLPAALKAQRYIRILLLRGRMKRRAMEGGRRD